ncbi:protein transport protein SEC31-like [Schistocerca piceifrons]|uniref:protein transport protein SEC31-like n=1 Tax=Schistocerca piceifrons TaxID=274613 RepID=UPI001F5FC395|nr:protein transport protein SEC31-like [Schistocerca piceifrons]
MATQEIVGNVLRRIDKGANNGQDIAPPGCRLGADSVGGGAGAAGSVGRGGGGYYYFGPVDGGRSNMSPALSETQEAARSCPRHRTAASRPTTPPPPAPHLPVAFSPSACSLSAFETRTAAIRSCSVAFFEFSGEQQPTASRFSEMSGEGVVPRERPVAGRRAECCLATDTAEENQLECSDGAWPRCFPPSQPPSTPAPATPLAAPAATPAPPLPHTSTPRSGRRARSLRGGGGGRRRDVRQQWPPAPAPLSIAGPSCRRLAASPAQRTLRHLPHLCPSRRPPHQSLGHVRKLPQTVAVF